MVFDCAAVFETLSNAAGHVDFQYFSGFPTTQESRSGKVQLNRGNVSRGAAKSSKIFCEDLTKMIIS